MEDIGSIFYILNNNIKQHNISCMKWYKKLIIYLTISILDKDITYLIYASYVNNNTTNLTKYNIKLKNFFKRKPNLLT